MAAAAKNQIQSELGGVSHQIFKKNISKKLKLTLSVGRGPVLDHAALRLFWAKPSGWIFLN